MLKHIFTGVAAAALAFTILPATAQATTRQQTVIYSGGYQPAPVYYGTPYYSESTVYTTPYTYVTPGAIYYEPAAPVYYGSTYYGSSYYGGYNSGGFGLNIRIGNGGYYGNNYGYGGYRGISNYGGYRGGHHGGWRR